MPQIFDNSHKELLPTLKSALGVSERADFCVGYFNLRGWRQLDDLVERWPGGIGNCCRLLVGMQKMPQDQLKTALSLIQKEQPVDQSAAIALKKTLAVDKTTERVPSSQR